MAEKKKILGLCAALAAVAILLILLLRGCGGTRVDSPTEPSMADQTTSATETTGTDETGETQETTEATEETTEETTEATEETQPEETQGSGGNDTPGGYNPDFGADDDDDEDDEDDEEETPFEAPAAGVENNPYIEKLDAVPGQIDTVLLPTEGGVYYEIHGAANSVLTLENAQASIQYGETTLTPDESGIIRMTIEETGEPVTICLSNKGSEQLPFLLNFIGPEGSESNPQLLETIEQITVDLAEGDSDGHYYLWNATQTGELTLQTQAEGYVVTVTVGETVVSTADSENGSVTFEVEEGQQVLIHVLAVSAEEGIYPAVQDTILGTMADKGTILNPYVRYLTELPAELATVRIPLDGYRVYDIYGAGETVLTITDADAVVVYNTVTFTPDENGVLTIAFDVLEPDTPARLAISCSGGEEKAFTLSFAYPEGSEKNPIVLEALEAVTLSLAGGEDRIRYCSYTPEKPGTVDVRIDSVEPETAVCGIRLITGEAEAAQEALPETAASAAVEAGQTLLICLEIAADETGAAPAAQVTLSGSFRLKEGLEENPIVLTVPEATVRIPAGESLYCKAQAPGMNMTLTGEEVSVTFLDTEYTVSGGQICIPCGEEAEQIFVVTNHAQTEGVYTIYFDYPLGSEENPALLELGENTAAAPEAGYRFAWTAGTSGQLTIASQQAWQYTIENRTGDNGVIAEGSELTRMVEVAAGDELLLTISGEGGKIAFTASFFDPTLGTRVNPILLELPESKLTLEAGETVFYRANVSGADMTLNGSGISVVMGEERFTLEKGVLTLRCKDAENDEVVFAFGNEGGKKTTFTVSFAYPAGSVRNPARLILGENTVKAEAGAAGYYLTWTAAADGELTLASDAAWKCSVSNLTADNAETSEGSGPSRTVAVHAGDELLICITPLDGEAPDALPGGSLVFTASFFDPTLGSEENPIRLNVPGDTITLSPGATCYYQADAEGMLLTLTGEDVTIRHNGAGYTPREGRILLPCTSTGPNGIPVFAVTNGSSSEVTCGVSFTWPEGHRENPIALTLEETACTLGAGTEGCWYTWTAGEDGILSLEMEADSRWSCILGNETADVFGELQTSGDETPELTIAVKAGDRVLIMINTFDPAEGTAAPAGTVKFTAGFEKTE